jgi:predicted nicotinamide N-methyase
MLSKGSIESIHKLVARARAARAAGDNLARHILKHPAQYPDLVPMAQAVLDPVVPSEQEAA